MDKRNSGQRVFGQDLKPAPSMGGRSACKFEERNRERTKGGGRRRKGRVA